MKYSYLLLCFFSLWFNQISAQGDFCEEAVLIDVGSQTANGPDFGNGANNLDAIHANWYQFVPTANGLLNVSSCNGGADTRLWVYQGSCDDLMVVGSNDDFCDLNDNGIQDSLFAAEVLNIPVFADSTYFIEWDDRWSSRGFTWTLDFVPLTADVGIIDNSLNFTQLPNEQPVILTATIQNIGDSPVSNVQLVAEIIDANDQTVKQTFSSNFIASFPGDAIQTVTAGTWMTPDIGQYLVRFNLNADNDQTLDNNLDSTFFDITDVTFADDDGFRIGGLGLSNPGVILRQGQGFDIFAADEIRSVSAQVDGGNLGDTVFVEIYEVVGENVGALLATSKKMTLTNILEQWLHFSFDRPLQVAAGQTIMAALVHEVTGGNIGLGVAEVKFTPKDNWLRIDNGDWNNLDAPPNNLQVIYMIRLNNGNQAQQVSVTVDMSEENNVSEVSVVYAKRGDLIPQTQPANSNGDGTWTATFSIQSLDTIGYFFANGDGSFPSQFETVPEACGVASGIPLVPLVRPLILGFEDIEIASVCFGECLNCVPENCANPIVIIEDDMENYTLGDLTDQVGAEHWSIWPGVPRGGLVSDDITDENGLPNQSIKIDGSFMDQDVLVLLGDRTSRHYSIQWQQYIPEGKLAYFNIQHLMPQVDMGFWAFDAAFNQDGQGQLLLPDGQEFLFTFPYDSWFPITLYIDIDNDVARLFIDEIVLASWPFMLGRTDDGTPSPSNQLNSINFFPDNSDHLYYIDNLTFSEIPAPASGQYCYTAESVQPGTHLVPPLDCFGGATLREDNLGIRTYWYAYTPNQDGFITIDACNSNVNTRSLIFEADCYNFDHFLGGSDDICGLVGGFPRSSFKEVAVNAGTTYFIMWNDVFSAAGFEWEFSFSPGPLLAGNFCQSAIPIQAGTHTIDTINGSASWASGTIGFEDIDGPNLGSEWYAFTPEFDGKISIASCLGDQDTRLHVYEGNCTELTSLAISDNDCESFAGDLDSLASRVDSLAVTAGLTYYLEWTSAHSSDGFDFILDYDFTINTKVAYLKNAFKLFPNPTSSAIRLSYELENPADLTILLANSLGQVLDLQNRVLRPNEQISIELDQYPNGLYWIQVTDGQQQWSKAIVKE